MDVDSILGINCFLSALTFKMQGYFSLIKIHIFLDFCIGLTTKDACKTSNVKRMI